MSLFGITRVRNEALIIKDTLEHFFAKGCEHILLYDDASEDDTVAIANSFGHKITVYQNDKWRLNRVAEETRHRQFLLNEAKMKSAEWVLCFDADERLIGDLPTPALETAFRFKLFDGYLTNERGAEYTGGKLENLLRHWGPEYRDILMLFNVNCSQFIGLDQREPRVAGSISNAPVFVKHFGKCLSIKHWEETCDYYVEYFPKRYSEKWAARKGKAIHVVSDEGRQLLTWQALMADKTKWFNLRG